MRINKVELSNITTHKNTTIDFTDGINVFSGMNGTGKSTVVKMIGYALFDNLSEKQADYISINSKYKTGSIKVWFVGSEGREYIIERKLGSSNLSVTDVETNAVLKRISKKVDLINFLKDQFNVDKSYQLETIFKNSVGPEQGTFTAPFLETDAVRKAVFDPIINVEIYKNIFDKLLPVYNEFKEKINDFEKKSNNLEGQIKDREDVQDNFVKKTEESNKLKSELNEISKNLNLKKSQFDDLKKLSDQINELDKQIRKLENQKGIYDTKIAYINNEINDCKNSEEICKKNIENFQIYEKSEKEREILNEQLKALDKGQKELNVVEKELFSFQKDFQNAQKEINEINSEASRKEELKNKFELHHEKQKKLKDFENKMAQIENEEAHLKELEKDNKNKEEEIKKIEEKIKDLPNIDELEEEKNKIRKDLDDFNRRSAELKSQQNELNTNKKLSKGGKCPFLKESCKNITGDSLEKYFEEKLQTLIPEMNSIVEEIKLNKKKMEEVEAKIRTGNELKNEASKLSVLKTEQEKLELKISESKKLIGNKEEIEKNILEIKKLMDELKSFVDEWIILKKKIEKIPDLTKQSEKIKKDIENLTLKQKELQEKIKPLSETKTKIEKLTEILKKTKNAYDLYKDHYRIAQKLPKKINEFENIKKQSIELLKTHQLKTEQFAKLNEAFDKDEFEKLNKSIQESERKISELNATIKGIEKNLEELKQKLDKYKEIEKELNKVLVDKKRVDSILIFTTRIRNWFKDAGPKITEALLHGVSREATNIFHDIMDRSNLKLTWESNYDITIESPLGKRSFSQLSGGEQMSAALSVRLAILQTLSKIDILFLDEPTTNLDTEKKQNLAESVRKIKNFSQIFLISHDDTFESMADNVIEFTKNSEEITEVK